MERIKYGVVVLPETQPKTNGPKGDGQEDREGKRIEEWKISLETCAR